LLEGNAMMNQTCQYQSDPGELQGAEVAEEVLLPAIQLLDSDQAIG
jgi:hypothetical protein